MRAAGIALDGYVAVAGLDGISVGSLDGEAGLEPAVHQLPGEPEVRGGYDDFPAAAPPAGGLPAAAVGKQAHE